MGCGAVGTVVWAGGGWAECGGGVLLRDRGVVGLDTRGGEAGCGQAEGELSALTAVVEEGVLGKGKAGRTGVVKTAHGAGEWRNGFFLLLCRKFCVFLHCL